MKSNANIAIHVQPPMIAMRGTKPVGASRSRLSPALATFGRAGSAHAVGMHVVKEARVW